MTLPILLLDTETTGVNHKIDKVVEVAWIEVDEELEVVDRDMSLIDPGQKIPPGASAVHGITDHMVIGAPTLDEYFEQILGRAMSREPVMFVAHNARFDYDFVGEYLHPDTLQLCTLKLARRLYPDMDNHKLGTLAYAFDLVDPTLRLHSAESDLAILLGLLKRMMADTGLDIDGLYDLSHQPNPSQKMTFGKHRGTPLKDLPRDYIHWLLNKTDIDADLRVALQSL